MKVGDKVSVTRDIYALFSKNLLLSKGSICTIAEFHGAKIITSNGFYLWPGEYELISKNHPHTDIFK